MKPQRVLITGGSGLIGSAIRKELKNQGIEYTYLTTSASRAKDSAEAFHWNPREGSMDEKALEGVDTVVHLAGSTINQPWTEKGKKDIIDSRVESTQTLLKALQNIPHSVKRVVVASAIGWYKNEFENWQKEDDSPGEGFLSEAVIRWEEELQKLHDYNLAIVRVGVVLSKDGGALPTIVLPVKLGIGGPIGSGKQYMPWVHIDDIVGIFMFLMENHDKKGIYNGVAPEPETNAAFTKKLAKALRRPAFFPAVPSFMMRLILGERADMVLRSSKVSAEKISQAGYTFKFSKLENALNQFYKPQ
jgi:uncharacterized protein (TIGR01777 family)